MALRPLEAVSLTEVPSLKPALPVVPTYGAGLGLHHRIVRGALWQGHSGGVLGAKASMHFHAEQGLGYVLLQASHVKAQGDTLSIEPFLPGFGYQAPMKHHGGGLLCDVDYGEVAGVEKRSSTRNGSHGRPSRSRKATWHWMALRWSPSLE
jgi:hypothetical protein